MEKNQLKIGVVLSYVNLIIGTIIPFFYTPIMLRLLGQQEYGLYSLSNSVISYLSLLTLGLSSTIYRYCMKCVTDGDKDALEHLLGLFIRIYAIISAVIIAVGCVSTLFTGTLFAKGLTSAESEKLKILIIIMSVGAGLSFFTSPFSSLVTCYERYTFQKLLGIAGTVAAPVINIIVLYLGCESVGIAVASLAIQLISSGINIWYCHAKLKIHPKFKNAPFHLLKEIFGFTAVVFAGLIADLLYWSTDKVLIGAMIGTAAVAVYNVGITFNSIVQQLSAAISGVFGPRVNQLVFSNRPMSEISELLIRVGRLQYLIVSLAVSGFIAFGKPFLLLWVGEGYEEAYYIALLTMVPYVIPLIQNIAFNTIVAMNRHKFRSNLYLALAIGNVISTYILIPIMGIIGAALCTFVIFIVGHGAVMNWFYAKKIGLDIKCFWTNIAKLTVVPALLAAVVLALENMGLDFSLPVIFLAAVLCYTIAFAALSWAFGMNSYEKSLVISAFKKVLRKVE